MGRGKDPCWVDLVATRLSLLSPLSLRRARVNDRLQNVHVAFSESCSIVVLKNPVSSASTHRP